MRAVPPLLAPLLAISIAGCSSDIPIGDKLNRPPAATISDPDDGATFQDIDQIDFLGVVADADGLGDIVSLEWTSDQLSEPLGTLDTAAPDANGYTQFATTLPAGAHAITLRVTDLAGDSAVASISLVVTPQQVDPNAEITVPAPGATFDLGEDVLLVGSVDDPNEPSDALSAVWSYSTDYGARTEIASVTPSGLGSVQATWTGAPLGQHQLVLTVTDGDGNVGEATIAVNIHDPNADDLDQDGFPAAAGDCDDNDPNRNPGLDETCDGVDNDCNNVVDDKDLDSDHHVDAVCALYPGAMPIDDCDDGDGTVFPGAAEQYDGLDNDCNGQIDDGLSEFDNDGDCSCSAPTCNGGSINVYCYTVVPGDCDDTDATLNPFDADIDGASSCDGDCDDADPAWNLLDADGDGASNCAGDCDDANAALNLNDADLDGTSTCAGDCDDGNALLNTLDVDADGASSCAGDCNDGSATLNLRDIDADGFTSCAGDCNDADPLQTPLDGDGDGASSCAGDCDDSDPALNLLDGDLDGFSSCNADCDDADPVLTPADVDADGASSCDGDCNDLSAVLNLNDADGDGASSCGGDCNDALASANILDVDGDGYSSCAGDCNDLVSALSPADVDGDGFSTCSGDCDDGDAGLDPADLDSDGFSTCDGDCDDVTFAVHPGGIEVPYNGLDDDCVGGDLVDVDGDGKDAEVAGGHDCDDNDASVHPGATEVCNGKDDDCDAINDENGAVGCTSYYYDGDDDTFGTGASRCQCGPKPTVGYDSTTNTDCYDANLDAYPAEPNYFLADRGDGSWDYDCDSVQTKVDNRSNTFSCYVVFGFPTTCYWSGGWETGGNPACGATKNWATKCNFTLTSTFCSPNTLTPVNQECK